MALPLLVGFNSGDEALHWCSASARKATTYAQRGQSRRSECGAGVIDGLNVLKIRGSAGSPSDGGPAMCGKGSPSGVSCSFKTVGAMPRRCVGCAAKALGASYM